jgi:hypothetical protein
MSFIIFPQSDNKLAVIIPAIEFPIEEVAAKDVPKNTPYAIVESLDIDGLFYDAYEYQDGNVLPNINKAKEIWLEHYRRARTPILTSLDLDFMKSVESGNTDLQKEIAQKKQALRDVTKTELPDNLEGIKNTWPSILGDNPFNIN